MGLLDWIGRRLVSFLACPREGIAFAPTCSPQALAAALRKGDVLLVDGSSRFAVAVKYLTQSTWSHAALVIGVADNGEPADPDRVRLVEADVGEGVRQVSLHGYAQAHTRICRPVGLSPEDLDRVVGYTLARVGHRYDLKNIFDLARYLIQTPPVPARWRRRMLALGSGDPTRAICSSLVARAFQSVRYPVLPEIEHQRSNDPYCRGCYDEILHIRHHSLFAPRDFDISPYFRVIKPTLEQGFDPYALTWGRHLDEAQSEAGRQAPA